jgi:hypothetical protein
MGNNTTIIGLKNISAYTVVSLKVDFGGHQSPTWVKGGRDGASNLGPFLPAISDLPLARAQVSSSPELAEIALLSILGMIASALVLAPGDLTFDAITVCAYRLRPVLAQFDFARSL